MHKFNKEIRGRKLLLSGLLIFLLIIFTACSTEENNTVENENQNTTEDNLEEVSIDIEDGTLHGTLTLTESTEPVPVVLIIPGSGPTDRRGNSPITGENNSLKMISDRLTESDYPSLRYDKRGIGESDNVKTSEQELRFEDFVSDVVEWVEFLEKDDRFSDIYILGHSQGSLTGMLAAQEIKLDGFISMAGAGESIADTLRVQIKTLSPKLEEEAENILNSLEKGETVSEVSNSLKNIFRPSVQPFLISYMKYDPAEEIKEIDIPVLIIQGTTDLQVSEKDARQLKEAYPRARIEIIEGMNHILKEAPADSEQNINTYSKPDLPLADGLMEVIVEFIEKHS
ncbi:MAG: alpha/beta hydrolase [Bacillota bacterium]